METAFSFVPKPKIILGWYRFRSEISQNFREYQGKWLPSGAKL